MQRVVFIDTSILLELLGVPGFANQAESIKAALAARLEAKELLLLPTAAIIETGNHIAQLPDGRVRRDRAEALMRVLRATAEGQTPWVLHGVKWDASLLRAICDGPCSCPNLAEMAGQRIGAGDISILAEAEAYAQRVARVKVEVWTLDAGLSGYA